MTVRLEVTGREATVAREQRTRKRYERQGKVQIFWIEDAWQRQITALMRNIGGTGMACIAPQRIPVGTLVRVECKAEHLHGDAVVRHCTVKGINYVVGLEFRGALVWRGAEDAPHRRGWD
jgi:hypothetical protein